MPLKIWLPSKFDIPFLGDLLQAEWVHYAFSWSGAIYDLSIPFLLLYRRTRTYAFVFVVIFHVLTRILFPIGMFPYIMIVGALIFFGGDFHENIINTFSKLLGTTNKIYRNNSAYSFGAKLKLVQVILTIFFISQLSIPLRHYLYPGELFWTEEGYRFSWRVMLIEKAGYANFKIVDKVSGNRFYVDNSDFLTPFQEKQMATQPDFILEYAHFLKDHFESQGHKNIGVYVDSYVALNGRLSQQYLDPEADLTSYKESFKHKKWILPFNDEIKGL